MTIEGTLQVFYYVWPISHEVEALVWLQENQGHPRRPPEGAVLPRATGTISPTPPRTLRSGLAFVARVSPNSLPPDAVQGSLIQGAPNHMTTDLGCKQVKHVCSL